MSHSTEDNCIYIFLDEGGNLDFSPKGTKYFSLTSVTTCRPFLPHTDLDEYKHDCIEFGLPQSYFHCTEDNQYVRKRVFEIINQHLQEYQIDSLLVEKSKTHPSVREDKRFYPEMMGHLLKYVISYEPCRSASKIIVITDNIPINKKRKAIEKAVKTTLARFLPNGLNYQIQHHDSKSSYGLQIADYCNWAIWKKWNSGEPETRELI
jgi:hypothetical protein